MATPLPLPPTGVQLFDTQTGLTTVQGQNYFNALNAAINSVTGAPNDAAYLTATANAQLTSEVNLGALATGFVKATVAAGTATMSTAAQIPVASGGTGANLSATGGTSNVLQQAAVGAAITVGQLSTTDISGLPVVTNGTYLPTLTGVANVSSTTAYTAQYSRVGAVVTVSGRFDLTPTSATTLTQFGISLPIASAFAAIEQCGGTAATQVPTAYSGQIFADTANARAEFGFTTAADTSSRRWMFTFTYLVV